MASRRDMLRTLVAGAAVVSTSPFVASKARAIEPPKPKTLVGPDLSDREKIIHMLNRLSYGPRPGEVDHILKEEGIASWVKKQLAPDSIEDSALEKNVESKFPWADKTSIIDMRKHAPEEGRGDRTYKSVKDVLPSLVLTRAVESNRRFKEVIVDFWRNHFCIDMGDDQQKSRRWTSGHYEDQVIRKLAFGKFKEMLFASARHPAMLEYLDNQLSRKDNWNENYAREVMELHTLGADRGYGNDDVRELSKVLTGWQYNSKFQFEFNAEHHQPGIKNWLGYKIPAGYEAGEKALFYLATHKYTAEFISMKLVRYLVNDNPPASLVKKVAAVFMESEGDLPKVYAAILNAPEFYHREHYRAKFKTPFQFIISALRATNAKIEDAHGTCQMLFKMGQPIYMCNDPTGYFDQAESWMDAGVLTSRWDYAWRLVRNGVSGIMIPPAFIERYAKMDESKRVQAIADEVVGGDVGERERKTTGETDRVMSVLLGGPSFQQR